MSGCVFRPNASLNNRGYDRLTRDGRSVLAHRAAWEDAHGPIPDGLEVDHICRNRACVNVAHLRLVTHRENLLAGDTIVARQCGEEPTASTGTRSTRPTPS